MSEITIKHRWRTEPIWSGEAEGPADALARARAAGAVLSGADLSDADLRGAVLRGAVLSGADLSDADLRGAVLSGADLRGAVLSGADLSDAVLRGAVLRGAVLSGADLSDADLRGAVLSGAVLSDETAMPGGETWREYRESVVPALLVAGGRSLADVLATGCWDCHQWSNCPMHAAFGIDGEEGAPALLRPRVREFVLLFDAGLIPRPEVPPADDPGAAAIPDADDALADLAAESIHAHAAE